MRQRKDWHLPFRFHIIKRKYNDPPQYGWLVWGMDDPYALVKTHATLDVWLGRTLWTFRRTH